VSDEVKVDGAFERLTADLVSLGFTRRKDGSVRGEVSDGLPTPEGVEITESPGYPFAPPRVRPNRGFDESWHTTPDGLLCLYSPRDSADLPWREAHVLVDHIAGWFRNDIKGWPDDPPVLDLERYFMRSGRKELLLIPDGFAHGDGVTFTPSLTHRCVDLSRAVSGTQPGPTGFYLDLRSIDRPFLNWQRLAERLGPDDAAWVEREIRKGRVSFLVLRYARVEQVGHLVLEVAPLPSTLKLAAMESSSVSDAALTVRSATAGVLGSKHVTIVGAGAIGSFLADQMVRAGVRRLRLIDHDILRPGNSVRHLAGKAEWGRPKVDGTRCVLRQHRPQPAVEAVQKEISDSDDARSAFAGTDLVVDASGSSWATGLLSRECQRIGIPMLVAYCQRAGEVVRVDRVLLNEGETWLPVLRPGAHEPPAVYDNGCGDPVSPTPPSAVLAAAAATARLAIDTLRFRPIPPTTLIQLVAQPDLDVKQE
jgi:molybdopterin/thiamine biosynthesis adenylyltransferase